MPKFRTETAQYGDSCSQTVKYPWKLKSSNFGLLRDLQRRQVEENENIP